MIIWGGGGSCNSTVLLFKKICIYFNTHIFRTTVHLWLVQYYSWDKNNQTAEQVLTCLSKYYTTNRCSNVKFTVKRWETGDLTRLRMLEVSLSLISIQRSPDSFAPKCNTGRFVWFIACLIFKVKSLDASAASTAAEHCVCVSSGLGKR